MERKASDASPLREADGPRQIGYAARAQPHLSALHHPSRYRFEELVLICRDVSTHARCHLTGPGVRVLSVLTGDQPVEPLPLPPGRAVAAGLMQQQPAAAALAGRVSGSPRRSRMRGVPAAAVWRGLRAKGCECNPASAETGVQREEMRLPVCELSCETAYSAACMCLCVHRCSSDDVRERASVDA